MERCEVLTADKGYDDTKRYAPLTGKDNIVYDYQGTVYCHCPKTNKRLKMPFGGFEKDRETLKYRCPATHYGIEGKGKKQCRLAQGVRIPLKKDRRVFTPIARSSYKWTTFYNQRTAVERVNSRLDGAYGLEKHFIRGLKKMKLRCTLALLVMLAMAVGRIREKQPVSMRSLVKAA